MNRIAICLTGVAFVLGCSATNGADDGIAMPADQQPGNELGEVPAAHDAGANLLVPVNFEPGTEEDTATAPPLVEDTGAVDDTAPEEDTGAGGGEDSGGTGEDTAQPTEPELPPPVVEPDPRVVDGNPTCAEAFATATVSFTHTPKGDGTYSADGATLTYEGGSVDVTSTRMIVGIIVKGGSAANVYSLMGSSATDLTTPYGHDISHVTICFAPPVT